MNILKKALSFILVLSIIVVSNVNIFAMKLQEKNTNDTSSYIAEQYKNYGIILPETYSLTQPDITVESLTSEAPILKKINESGINVVTYDKEYFSDYIIDCKDVLSVDMIEKTLYIDYETLQNERVILTYSSNGLEAKSIYDYDKDKAVFITGGSGYVEENFLAGTVHKISDNQNRLIDKAIENNNIEELYEIDGIFVEDFNGSLIIDFEPNVMTYGSTTNFVPPSSQFVPYTKKVISTEYKYSSALDKDVKISVKESMDTYKKTRADYKSFAVGTALTAISYYLGGPASAAVKVLTAMGVLNSTKDAITETITLYKSASYDYIGAREGYAYDTTIHKKDVKVYFNSSKGVLHGGNNADGVFTWIDYQPSKALSKSTNTIIDKTIYNYNADLVVNDGYCTLYFPD